MDRRTAVMTLMALPLAQVQIKGKEKGILTIDLNMWRSVVVRHDTHEVEIPVSVLFAELTKDNP